jgi:uncharacterized membrane protein YdfJ with MMPL/SSD domain
MIIVPLIVYIALLPAAARLFSAELVVGGIDGNTPSTKYALQHIMEDFPAQGGGVPLVVMLTPNHTVSVKSDLYFEIGCQLAASIVSKTGLPTDTVQGVMIDHTKAGAKDGKPACIPWSQANASLTPASFYSWAWHQSVNDANTSTLLLVTPSFDAFSNEAKTFVEHSRDALDAFQSAPDRSGWTAVSFHPMGANVDAEELASARFAIVVALTALVVFCLVGLRYRAALIPVKLFFTIALPILAVMGIGVLVFQDGVLDWTGIPSFKSQGGLVWINPLACTFMLIGFGLDYDIFLFSRIYATRKSGQFTDDRSAIVHAVATTGPVITTAGVIMALAFSGMIVQHDNPFLNQMGFTMILGVLVDTFIVRILLVPAILSMAGKLNWWPGKMPQSSVDISVASSSRRAVELA